MDFHVPELGEGVYEAELVDWRIKAGDRVKRGQNLMEVLTDKATMEVPSPFAGTLTALHAEPGQQIKVGQLLLSYDPPGQAEQEPGKIVTAAPALQSEAQYAATAAPEKAPLARTRDGNGSSRQAVSVKAAPSVRYMARKLGIDLARVQGSGPEGRILIEDLSRHVQPDGGREKQLPAGPKPDYGTPGTRMKLQGLRRRIAEHLVHAKRTVPHYTYVDECEVSELVRVREGLRPSARKAGVKMTYLAFIVKAVAAALKEVPIVNASLDDKAGEIVLHDRYHIGIAVAAPQGLIVPVVRDADQKDLFQIARDIERLSAEARASKVKLEDLRGGTFTITSIGGIGGLFATPIINHPEVGILGIGKVVKRPICDAAGNVKAADMVYLSFSFDHRVVDGAVGAVFGNTVMKQLQNPVALLVPEKN